MNRRIEVFSAMKIHDAFKLATWKTCSQFAVIYSFSKTYSNAGLIKGNPPKSKFQDKYNRRCGILHVICYFASTLSNFLISVNLNQ